MQREGGWEGGVERGMRWMYLKLVLCACATPPPPRGRSDGVQRWKGDFEEGVILPSLPRRRRKRDQSRGPWHSKRCQDTHTLSTFHIMHLTSFKSTFEGNFTVHFITLWDFFFNWPCGGFLKHFLSADSFAKVLTYTQTISQQSLSYFVLYLLLQFRVEYLVKL